MASLEAELRAASARIASSSVPREIVAATSGVMPALLAVDPNLTMLSSSEHVSSAEIREQLGFQHLPDLPLAGNEFLVQDLIDSLPDSSVCRKLLLAAERFREVIGVAVPEFAVIHRELAPVIALTRDSMQERVSGAHPALHTADQLCVWFLRADGNGASLIGWLYNGFARRTIDEYVYHVCECIKQRFADEIRWPNAEERKDMHGGFAVHPQAVAAFDGTHLEIRRPSSATEEMYYSSHKHRHSQNFLIGVDCYGFIVYLSDPKPGRSNDRTLWNDSYIANHLSEFLSKGECLLVDGGFKGDGPLLRARDKKEMSAASSADELIQWWDFNTEFVRDRSLVEHVIGRVKGQSECLGHRFYGTREHQSLMMRASSCLYNRIHRARWCKQVAGIDDGDDSMNTGKYNWNTKLS